MKRDFYGGGGPPLDQNKSDHSQKNPTQICESIRNYSRNNSLEQEFRFLMEEIYEEAAKFSPDLAVEYHVVIFNPNNQTRFTILETKRGNYKQKSNDCKDSTYGLVGKLYDKNRISEFLIVQYGFHSIEPVFHKHCPETNTLEKLDQTDISDYWTPDEKKAFYWASSGKTVKSEDEGGNTVTGEERKYAIAATIFYDHLSTSYSNLSLPLGAITLDFNTKPTNYPHFSFRDSELQAIYHMLKRMRIILELMVSKSTTDSLCNVINIALGRDIDHGNPK